MRAVRSRGGAWSDGDGVEGVGGVPDCSSRGGDGLSGPPWFLLFRDITPPPLIRAGTPIC
jgi:hypothetical protein